MLSALKTRAAGGSADVRGVLSAETGDEEILCSLWGDSNRALECTTYPCLAFSAPRDVPMRPGTSHRRRRRPGQRRCFGPGFQLRTSQEAAVRRVPKHLRRILLRSR